MNPKVLMLNITEKCNSHCIMCGIWKKENPLNLDLGRFKQFFHENKSELLEVDTVGLVGGEPFLSPEYLEYIRFIVENFPKLKTIGTPTNGIMPQLNLNKIKSALEIIPASIFYGVSVSIDGVGSIQDQIRGIKGLFERNIEFITAAREEFSSNDNFYITITSTISKANLNEIKKLQQLAKELKVRITFRPAMEVEDVYINNVSEGSSLNKSDLDWRLTKSDNLFLKEEFYRLYQETHNEYYLMISGLLEEKKRDYPCIFQNSGIAIHPNNKITMCLFTGKGELGNILSKFNYNTPILSETKSKVIREICKNCSAECYTSKDSRTKRNDFIQEQLLLVLSNRMDEVKENLKANGHFEDNEIITALLEIKEKNRFPEKNPLSEELAVIRNTFYGNSENKVNNHIRKCICLDYSSTTFPDILLNLAKYYYILKIYGKANQYLNALKLSKPGEKTLEEIRMLEQRMALK